MIPFAHFDFWRGLSVVSKLLRCTWATSEAKKIRRGAQWNEKKFLGANVWCVGKKYYQRHFGLKQHVIWFSWIVTRHGECRVPPNADDVRSHVTGTLNPDWNLHLKPSLIFMLCGWFLEFLCNHILVTSRTLFEIQLYFLRHCDSIAAYPDLPQWYFLPLYKTYFTGTLGNRKLSTAVI